MTKFMNIPIIPTVEDKKKEFKPTVFTHCVNFSDKTFIESSFKPTDFKNITWLGKDKYYGDTFKAWNVNFNDFFIFFGVKGDEEYS